VGVFHKDEATNVDLILHFYLLPTLGMHRALPALSHTLREGGNFAFVKYILWLKNKMMFNLGNPGN
jgi:hypothetical protein